MTKFLLPSLLWLAVACGNPVSPNGSSNAPSAASAPAVSQGELVTPPFAVRDDAEGLLLVWYDEQGTAHPAGRRSEVPEAQRARVRVDSLDVAPEKRLDPAFVYVADLRAAKGDGSYEVRKLARDALEAAVSKPVADNQVAAASGDVIIYGASWCGACKQAARYLRQKSVPFVEKDIEKEPAARTEMLAKAKAQGVSTQGIPVIDVRGKLLPGFDPQAVDALLR